MTVASQMNTRRRLAVLFAIPVAFSLFFFLVSQSAEHTDIRLLQIQNMHTAVTNLATTAQDAQAGERGFLLTGDEHYLVPLQQANAVYTARVHECETYSAEWPNLRDEVRKLIKLVKNELDLANHTLDVQRAQGFAAALDIVRGGGSEQSMNDIRRAASALQDRLYREQADYLRSQRDLNRFAFTSFLIGTIIMLVVLVWLYNALVSYLTARDAAHAQLQQLNIELEERVEERTQELQQSNTELQQFAYVASHDLQEPLRTITSFTQLLANRYKGQLDEDADEFIGYIITSSRRMTDLINGLLAMVRLRKSGHGATEVAFTRLLEEAEITLQAAIRENNVKVEYGSMPLLVVNKVQFLQVFQNLISNAIKYRREEAPHIRIAAQRENSTWTFSVSDNGRGFEQEFAERIFGLFQRLHRSEVEGTGMGLSIAKAVVERHGGRMWAESKPGVGSTFYFSLPVSLEISRRASEQQAVNEARV